MSRTMLSAVCGASLLLAVPTVSLAQYDLTTCSGNYNYCLEQTRRIGRPSGSCDAAYQDCMRRGMTRDLSNPCSPRPIPVERR